MSKLSKTILSCLCSVAMAVSMVPAVAVSALASSAFAANFQVDGLSYYIVLDKAWVVSYDPSSSALQGIVTIPATVTDPSTGKAYAVSGLESDSLANCTTMTELRLGDSDSTGLNIHADALSGCTNLKTIHFMGAGSFNVGISGYTKIEQLPSGVDVVYHKAGKVVFDVGFKPVTDYDPSNIIRTYYAVDFDNGQQTAQIYVRGNSINPQSDMAGYIDDGTEAKETNGLKASDVYCDSSLGEDSICPNSASDIPACPSGEAWSLTTYDGDKLSPSTHLSTCATAQPVSLVDLDYGEVLLESSVLSYKNASVEPTYTVYNAEGGEVASSNYDVSYEVVKCERPLSYFSIPFYPGTYTLVITGLETAGYSGSCTAEFAVERTSSIWARANAGSERTMPFAVNRSAANLCNITGTSVSADALIFVNPADTQSCLIADSLAGLYGCMVVPTDGKLVKDELPTEVNLELVYSGGGTDALVIGSEAYISEDFRQALAQSSYTNTASRAASSAEAAKRALEVIDFASEQLDVSYSGSFALVVPENASSAALFSAVVWANTVKAPVLFAADNGQIDADTASYLGNCTSVKIAGFNASAVSAIKGYVAKDAQVEDWGNEGADAAKAATYAADVVKTGATTAKACIVCNPDDQGALAASAAVAGLSKSSLLLSDTASCDDAYGFINDNRLNIRYGLVAATEEQMSDDALYKIKLLWASSDDLSFSTVTLSKTSFTYNGKAHVPTVEVKDFDGKTLTLGTDYLVYYKRGNGNDVGESSIIAAGEYVVSISAVAGTDYSGTNSASFVINKASQKITAKNVTKSFKASSLRKAKAFKLSAKALDGAKITYKVASKDSKGVLSLAKSGKVTVKKRAKKGTYSLKATVTAAATSNYGKATSKVKVTVKVK